MRSTDLQFRSPGKSPLSALLGSEVREAVLLYLFSREEGYARQIAAETGYSLNSVQAQLERLEAGGVLVRQSQGRVLLFSFNPNYPLRRELKALLRKAGETAPVKEPEPNDTTGRVRWGEDTQPGLDA